MSKHRYSKADSHHPLWVQNYLLRDTFLYNDSVYFVFIIAIYHFIAFKAIFWFRGKTEQCASIDS